MSGIGTEVPGRADMLGYKCEYNYSVFNDEDFGIIDGLYNDEQNRGNSFQLLAIELCNNLRDDKGIRTRHFDEIVKLGLLNENVEYSFLDATCPRAGSELLTPKGAAFLGISLGNFAIAREVTQIRDDCGKAVEKLTRDAERHVGVKIFYSGIIDTQSELRAACPAQYTLLQFLEEIMLIMSGLNGLPIKDLPKLNRKEFLSGMHKLGWINNPEIDDNLTIRQLLTEAGANRLTAYMHLLHV